MLDKKFSLNADFKLKNLAEDEAVESLTIEGYANTTEKDRVGDIVLEEAWKKGGLNNYMTNPIVLAFHDHTKPVGKVVDFSVDSKGLKVVAEISKAAGNVADLIKDGILKTFSVGFGVKDAAYDEKEDIFFIKDLELLEISVVSVPANASSVFSVKKAFDTDEDYNTFKKEFIVEEPKEESPEEVKASESDSKMDELSKQLAEVLAKQNEILSAKAIEPKQETEKEKMTEQVFTKEMVEDLLKAAEDRISQKFETDQKSLSESLEGLKNDLSEKAAELEALQKNKMRFENPTAPVDAVEKDSAVLLAKAMGRSIEKTKYGKKLIEKAGVSPHLGSTTDTWEEEFSMRLESDIRQRLVMEPLFRTIQMNVATMHIPVNPEAGYGEWIARTYTPLRSSDGSSTGTAVDHEIVDTSLTAHKLVAKEYLGDEEEEDSILPLMPIVRDAVMRRMTKASDRALLRADSGQATGDGDTYPFNGIATVGLDAGNTSTLSIAGGEKVTVASLAAARRKLGVWGLDPSQLIYIVSVDAYYDLLDDDDFRTIDLVGSQATILRGQIGSANGSPVVVSGEFASKASGATAVVCANPSNFLVGNLRNVRIETDRSVEDQKNILVASRRMGFIPVVSAKGSAVIKWTT